MKKLLLAIIGLVALTLAACGNEDTSTLSEDKLVVGSMAGDQAEIVEFVAEIAAEDGLEIEVMTFSDYIMPNTALEEGDLDANIYQTLPFLDQYNEDHGTDFVPVGAAFLNPMAIFSEKYESIDEVEDGALFALPNDPTNGARALLMLQETGLIKVNEEETNPSVMDIVENPKNLEFIELEAAQIPRQLSEVDFAAINSNYSFEAGLNPIEDSIYRESTDSPYTVNIVVRAENEDDPAVQKLVDAYQSDAVKDKIEEVFGGTLLPGWE
ncbi:MetQ/NlpA family ABC transporter substrate-binding protein [Oceanobacillus damuensis]|uniref:MetQ/NlpA family ABC transporter substrate-binding protein n=1 Tax=Oceanobacillus damuensis TaxID=937928 RepID=UPI0008379245|nr:MetQ/NlpA family ABC transporter substrate-binding protein [Oceanobacillus damuensis]